MCSSWVRECGPTCASRQARQLQAHKHASQPETCIIAAADWVHGTPLNLPCYPPPLIRPSRPTWRHLAVCSTCLHPMHDPCQGSIWPHTSATKLPVPSHPTPKMQHSSMHQRQEGRGSCSAPIRWLRRVGVTRTTPPPLQLRPYRTQVSQPPPARAGGVATPCRPTAPTCLGRSPFQTQSPPRTWGCTAASPPP